MARHDLKTWPSYFEATWDGYKRFEVRENDRNFAIRDVLVLREWDNHPLHPNYTGRVIGAVVTYICYLPLPVSGYVGMQIEVITKGDNSYPEGWDAQPREHK